MRDTSANSCLGKIFNRPILIPWMGMGNGNLDAKARVEKVNEVMVTGRYMWIHILGPFSFQLGTDWIVLLRTR